jgi:hypothetical protein
VDSDQWGEEWEMSIGGGDLPGSQTKEAELTQTPPRTQSSQRRNQKRSHHGESERAKRKKS